jgi:hypothetical protein
MESGHVALLLPSLNVLKPELLAVPFGQDMHY